MLLMTCRLSGGGIRVLLLIKVCVCESEYAMSVMLTASECSLLTTVL